MAEILLTLALNTNQSTNITVIFKTDYVFQQHISNYKSKF